MDAGEYLRISFTSDNGLLCRVLAQETKYGRDVLRVEYPSSSGKVKIAILFIDKFEIIQVPDAAEVESDWNRILGNHKAQPTAASKTVAPEFCHDETCIEPANESGYCDAHEPAKEK